MNSRLDALATRQGSDGKTYFTKIGAAFPTKDGSGWMVILDAMPAPLDGAYKVLLKPPMERDGQRDAPRGGGSRVPAALDDEVPFAALRELP